MFSVKLLTIGVEVMLVLCLVLTGRSSFVWIRAYLKNRLEMQNALYDSTSTEKEMEQLEAKEDECKRNSRFYIAFSVILVAFIFGVALIIKSL